MNSDEVIGDSTEEAVGGGLPRGLLMATGLGAVAVIGVVLYLVLAPTGPPVVKPMITESAKENPLEQARETLLKATDLNACRSALQQVNAHLSEKPGDRPPALAPEQQQRLQSGTGATADELAEAANVNYTLLDGHHLDRCFLFRDAAERAVAVGSVGSGADGKAVRRTPLQQAAAAFAWVVRQVSLAEPVDTPIPPQWVLRRGSGTPLDRALVFLALLDGFSEEDRPQGCLLWVRDAAGKLPRLWACGVLAGDSREIYLFDPRLGLPLPGADGKGIATLAAIRKEPRILGQLQLDADNRYDISPERAAAVELTVVCTLSALVPRMRHLQDKLLPPVRVNLTQDPAEAIAHWKAALDSAGDKTAGVQVWKEGVGLQRRFLPVEEGGMDRPQPFPLKLLPGYTTPSDPNIEGMTRKRFYELTLVPWRALPDVFRDTRQLHNVALGPRVRNVFSGPFIRAVTDAHQPRDWLLRGSPGRAIDQLVPEMQVLKDQVRQLRDQTDLDQRVTYWIQQSIPVYAALIRARESGSPEAMEAANRQASDLLKGSEAVQILVTGAQAGPRLADLTYLLAQCKHEEAEELQGRLDLLAEAGAAAHSGDSDKARLAWRAALGWWERFRVENPASPARTAARRLQARAELARGNREAAAALLEDVSAPMTPLEKLADLLEAKRIKRAKP
jgi:hypothetical protein